MNNEDQKGIGLSRDGKVKDVVILKDKDVKKKSIPYFSFDEVEEGIIMVYNTIAYHGIFQYPEGELIGIGVVSHESASSPDFVMPSDVPEIVDIDRIYLAYQQKEPIGFFILPNGRVEFDYNLTVNKAEYEYDDEDDDDIEIDEETIEALKRKGGLN